MIFTTSAILLLVYSILLGVTNAASGKKTYIVHLKASTTNVNAKRNHVLRRADLLYDQASVIYKYDNTIKGFAAVLDDAQVQALKAQDAVLSVVEDKARMLFTTRTPAFLGLVDTAKLLRTRSTAYSAMTSLLPRNSDEANIIIGVVDTGVWPENAEFDDKNMPNVPERWKGSCEEGEHWSTSNCNNKLIGAAAFYRGYLAAAEAMGVSVFNGDGQYKSPRDTEGHGTHTATTAGGSPVADVSLFGNAKGTARGMAQDSRLSIYKVCWNDLGDTGGCFDSDILAGMDKAISDGVNIISGSIGANGAVFQDDAITLGTFAAMQKGIFTSFAAGNLGPDPFSVTNNNPWVLTTAASSLDRDFPATVTLGNGKIYTGASLYSAGSVPDVPPLASSDIVSIIVGEQASAASSKADDSKYCAKDSLDPAKVAGKFVVCVRGGGAGRVEKGGYVKKAGGRGMILINAQGEELLADPHLLPAVALGEMDGAAVLEYAKTDKASGSFNFEGTVLGVPAPVMSTFSARGPNDAIPYIMKPDVTAPGLNILAGFSKEGNLGSDDDTRRVDFNVLSGTSMSCPHSSGIAAYIMARRPDWSIAAVRSAMMTTAYVTSKGGAGPMQDSVTGKDADPFSFGNGHIDPIPALTPGLIYDVVPQDYIDFVCAFDPDNDFLASLTRSNLTCQSGKKYDVYALNYPSFAAVYPNKDTTGTYTATMPRTLTNVGGAGTYKVTVALADTATDLVKVTVTPDTLTFGAAGDKQNFQVVVEMTQQDAGTMSHGRLVWSNGENEVASSIGFYWEKKD